MRFRLPLERGERREKNETETLPVRKHKQHLLLQQNDNLRMQSKHDALQIDQSQMLGLQAHLWMRNERQSESTEGLPSIAYYVRIAFKAEQLAC